MPTNSQFASFQNIYEFRGHYLTAIFLPSADFVVAVATRQIRQRTNYSSPRTNQRTFDNAFVYILYLTSFINRYNNCILQWQPLL